jgi:hypothetical protein
MSKIINFFGGPGVGKSTQSSDLYSIMKKNNKSVELTFEFPKLIAWDGNFELINDQFFITANQHRNISRLYGKVDYIIVDSPIILGLVYKLKYSSNYPATFYDGSFDDFILSLFRKYESINIFLNRGENEFESSGRFQKQEESLSIDNEIKVMLNNFKIDFIEFGVNNTTSKDIYEYIFKK